MQEADRLVAAMQIEQRPDGLSALAGEFRVSIQQIGRILAGDLQQCAMLGKIDHPIVRGARLAHAQNVARAAQKAWSAKPAIERAGYLRRIASKLRENVAHLARTITLEQGKISALAECLYSCVNNL